MYDRIEEGKGKVILKDVRDFDLKDIFDCGQCFRWNPEEDGSYSGVAFGRAVNLSCEKRGETADVTISNCSGEDFYDIWENYFDLKRDYGKIKAELTENDEVMKQAAGFGGGIRILNQDEWETLISFILSQNRNIPLIKSSIENISRRFGTPVKDHRGETRYAFPEPEIMAELTEADLAECRLGYRTRYVIETSRHIADNKDELYEMTGRPYEEALKYLTGLTGVGPKVANCILLFSMEKYSSFPIDVWVRRLMAYFYGTDEGNLKQIRDFAQEKFGKYGGFAQQYLFYYARENSIGK